MSTSEGSKLVSNSTAMNESSPSKASSGRPIYPGRKESALEVIRNAIPSPEGHSGGDSFEKEKRHEKDAVEFVSESRNRIG